ncbi:RNA-directed DNA polymerase, eukaryota, reverse transcriptase zinc-binding domain protein [Tanacetum coccineum]
MTPTAALVLGFCRCGRLMDEQEKKLQLPPYRVIGHMWDTKHISDVGSNSINISHLQYADDAIILGKWSVDNAKNLCRILRCFHLASGLKGANMNVGGNWEPIIDKFHKRLSSWKAKTLSYGGRLTLLKLVLGALGSLQASNIAMLSKWWWRFYTENNSFWRLIITSIHGRDGGLGENIQLSKHIPGPWKTIISLNRDLSKLNIDMSSVFVKQVGDGSSTRFWLDVWLGNSALKEAFPRLFLPETNSFCSISERCLVLSVEADYWKFTINNPHVFSVSVMRKHIDNQILDSSGTKVRWNKNIPIKINIFAWRWAINRLPTRYNLDICGIDLDSTLCPVCNEAVETSIFFLTVTSLTISGS